jgi:hypothetical protein
MLADAPRLYQSLLGIHRRRGRTSPLEQADCRREGQVLAEPNGMDPSPLWYESIRHTFILAHYVTPLKGGWVHSIRHPTSTHRFCTSGIRTDVRAAFRP